MKRELTIRLLNGFMENQIQFIRKAHQSSKTLGRPYWEAGRAIAWSCYIFKEWVSDSVSEQLLNLAQDLMEEDYDWLKLPSVLASSYIIKEDDNIRNRLLQQISHGNSDTRENIVKAVGFMAPLLSFSNSYLNESVETNIERSHFYYQESTVLYLCTQGSDDDKRRWALEAKQRFDEFDDHKAFFNDLFEQNEYYQNSFFADTFSRAKSNVIFNLLAKPELSDQQSGLFNKELNAEEIVSQLRDREQVHHLSTSYIDLSCLKEKKTGFFSEE